MTISGFIKSLKLRFYSTIPQQPVAVFNSPFNPLKPTQIIGYLRSFGGAFPPIAPLPLPSALFAVPPRLDLIHRVICWFRAGERAGLASAKGRGEVAGSNRKIHAQKGTGRARAGDARAPHRRGGNLKLIISGSSVLSLSRLILFLFRWSKFRTETERFLLYSPLKNSLARIPFRSFRKISSRTSFHRLRCFPSIGFA
jgi:hypothetical protein